MLQAAEADIKADLERVSDEALKYGLGFGVAFLHDTMAPSDRAIAERFFASGAIHVPPPPPTHTSVQSISVLVSPPSQNGRTG